MLIFHSGMPSIQPTISALPIPLPGMVVQQDQQSPQFKAFQACANGHEELALRLLAHLGEKGPNTLLPSHYGWYNCGYAFLSPLGIALRHAHHDLALALLRAGADPNRGAVTMSTPPWTVDSLLHAFCLCERTPTALEGLLSLPGATANRQLESTMPIFDSAWQTLDVTPLQIAY